MNTDKKITAFVMTIIMLIVAVLYFVAFLVGKCNAESAIVSFNLEKSYAIATFDSTEHLPALIDSVVAVCDTNYVNVTVWNELGADSFRVDITCRELDRVIVSKSLRGIFPGEAIIYWRRVTK